MVKGPKQYHAYHIKKYKTIHSLYISLKPEHLNTQLFLYFRVKGCVICKHDIYNENKGNDYN